MSTSLCLLYFDFLCFRFDALTVLGVFMRTELLRISVLRVTSGPRVEFVCVEVLRPSQPHGVMSIAVSLPNHTFTGQA